MEQEELGIKKLHFYENYIPMVADVDKNFSYEGTNKLESH